MKKLHLIAIIVLLSGILLGGCEEEVPPDRKQVGCVTLYEDLDLKGKSKKICGSTNYVGKDFDNKASSLTVDCEAREIVIYTEPNFEGKELKISANHEGTIKGKDLKKKLCTEVQHVGDDYNDKISSIKVIPN